MTTQRFDSYREFEMQGWDEPEDPAQQQPKKCCSFCGEGLTCEHGYCKECQICVQCAEESSQ